MILDAYTEEIVGWSVGPTLDTEYPLRALDMALGRTAGKAVNLVHHSDRGCQYASKDYVNKLNSNNIMISMTETGDPKDNAQAERINNTMKNELLYGKVFYNIDEVQTDIVPLLYYTGYLTIKEFVEDERLYILGFPNYEVEMSFFKSLAREFYGSPDSENGFKYSKFLSDFRAGDIESVIERIKALFCTLPYANDKSVKLVERDFQNVIFLVFSILGEYIIAEPHFSKGRADAILINKTYVYLFEFKIDQDAQTALNQIDAKNYAGRFKMDNRKIFKIGVNFSST